MAESKEPIRLRQRKTASGNISLYLDIYLNGKRTYEFLKMHLIPERTRADRERNRETLKLADAIRAKRVVELRNGQFGFQNRPSASIRFSIITGRCAKNASERKAEEIGGIGFPVSTT